jgi:hypothetical protein
MADIEELAEKAATEWVSEHIGKLEVVASSQTSLWSIFKSGYMAGVEQAQRDYFAWHQSELRRVREQNGG